MNKLFKFESILAIFFVSILVYAIYPKSDQSKKTFDHIFGTELYKAPPLTIEQKEFYSCYKKLDKKYKMGLDEFKSQKLFKSVEEILLKRRTQENYCIDMVDICGKQSESDIRGILVKECLEKSNDDFFKLLIKK